MNFKLPEYREPNFNDDIFVNSHNAKLEEVEIDGVAPDNYHATTIYPEYFKVNGKWILTKESRMDCVAVVNKDNTIDIKEFRNLRAGDMVVTGRSEDGTEGIYVHINGFTSSDKLNDELFSFRSGRSRETGYSIDYDRLYEILKYEKDHGYIVWVLGPAVVFDHYSRESMAALIKNGYADALFGGNAVATHDMEAAVLKTALGQNIYNQASMKNGHYNHIDVINKVRRAGSIEKFIYNENIDNGVINACVRNNVPMVLSGSIRDDGPLPDVISDVYESQDKMRSHIKKATTVICLATMLHTIATGNVTPSYQVVDGKVRPVFIYTIDASEFAVNKLRDRGSLEVTSIVTNVQDFLTKLKSNLITEK